ncbi:MAG TPA: hypothetical protein VGG03_25100 [Thermoanaerobaculia bacterium]
MSLTSTGGEANSDSFFPDISADGRFVVFTSGADNIVPGENQFFFQVFLRDRAAGTTERISQDAAGNPGDGNSTGRW